MLTCTPCRLAHTDYGTDIRIGQGVGEWLTRIIKITWVAQPRLLRR
ncbi:MAG: hypothetical protein SWX82_16120 [Cyanobacteriota bacterium]|nr:hypothetical protein [Cyanobacteriota bacterium]